MPGDGRHGGVDLPPAITYGRGGPRVVALHGFFGSRHDFRMLADQPAFFGTWTCLDLPGHGDSLPCPRELDFDHCCEGVERAIAALDEPPVLLGYSFGGRVALGVAIRRRVNLRALVLVSAATGLRGQAEREARKAADARRADRLRSIGCARFLEEWLRQPLLASQKRMPEPWLSSFMERRRKADAEGLARALEQLGTGSMPDFGPELERLEIPALFMVGDEDAKFRKIGETAAGRVKHGRFVVLPGVGHACWMETPSAFLRIAKSSVSEIIHEVRKLAQLND